MSVNFKDFAVETRFVVAICSGACATFSTRTTSWSALCGSTFRLIVFNGLINTADLPLMPFYILLCFLESSSSLVAFRTNKQICSRVSAPIRSDIFTNCQLDQAGKIDYTFPKILTPQVSQQITVSKRRTGSACIHIRYLFWHFSHDRPFRKWKNIYIPT